MTYCEMPQNVLEHARLAVSGMLKRDFSGKGAFLKKGHNARTLPEPGRGLRLFVDNFKIPNCKDS